MLQARASWHHNFSTPYTTWKSHVLWPGNLLFGSWGSRVLRQGVRVLRLLLRRSIACFWTETCSYVTS